MGGDKGVPNAYCHKNCECLPSCIESRVTSGGMKSAKIVILQNATVIGNRLNAYMKDAANAPRGGVCYNEVTRPEALQLGRPSGEVQGRP
eukprot:2326261-Lingulodinium_polyedra.AAC.1